MISAVLDHLGPRVALAERLDVETHVQLETSVHGGIERHRRQRGAFDDDRRLVAGPGTARQERRADVRHAHGRFRLIGPANRWGASDLHAAAARAHPGGGRQRLGGKLPVRHANRVAEAVHQPLGRGLRGPDAERSPQLDVTIPPNRAAAGDRQGAPSGRGQHDIVGPHEPATVRGRASIEEISASQFHEASPPRIPGRWHLAVRGKRESEKTGFSLFSFHFSLSIVNR